MMKDRTYPRRGLTGELVHEIGLRIVRGELPPGASIPADGEPGEATVSRTVVREAIKVLAAKGLVAARPKTGTQVRERRYWNLMDPDVLSWRIEAEPGDGLIADVFELRRLLEPTAAALAATRASEAEVEELGAAYAQMEANVADDSEAYIAADLQFHAIILEACHNELLAQLGSTLRAVFRASFTRTHGGAVKTLPMHEAVLAGIRLGDGERAESAMRALIDGSAALLDEPAPAKAGR
jgi:DNA-binding FadR family transcriptional regulator